ncbi:MAG: DUF3179 domain-containing protein [Chloroflexi bacterium]|nr:DUF3179 domain-containing protein [Chloroflexota bacterium]
MSRIRRAGVFWPVVSLLVLSVAACSSDDGGPTSAPAPATPEATSQPLNSMSGELDLSYLPDDPTELMMATLDEKLDRVARKMAYSGNQAYIPVLLEFLRFQAQEEAIINLTSFLSRLKDDVPPEELMLFSPEQSEWKWWIEWLGNNPQVQPPEGYVGWKSQLYSLLDPGLGAFLYDGVKTDIRIEEVIWGGVAKDGIPDLTDPPVVSASEADYMLPEDRVFGVSINGQHRAYPLRIMNRHEMANDVIAGVPFALAY